MKVRDASENLGVAREAGPRMRKMTVSEALRWAWGDELPKEASGSGMGRGPALYKSAWSAIEAYAELHSIVDRQPNRFGCIPFDNFETPHPDAYRIANTVARLAGCAVNVPDGWHPMPELAEVDEAMARRAVNDALNKATVLDALGAIYFRARPDVLVVRHAILGIVPDWRMSDRPNVEYEIGANGRHRWFVRREIRTVIGENADGTDKIAVETAEVDGWSSRLKRPVAGAYRKAHFVPDPVPVMVARAEYEIFCAAMSMLADDLAGQLDTIDIVPIEWPAQPWGDSPERSGDSRGGKVLPDLSALAANYLTSKTSAKSKGKSPAKSARNAA